MQSAIEFKTGDYILREFEKADCAYVILHGEVGIFKRGPNDEIIPLGILKAGEYLGELGIVSGKSRSAEAIALSPVAVVKITGEILERELSKVPGWVSALLVSLAERLLHADELLGRLNIPDPNLLQKIEPAVHRNLAQSKRTSA
jgi:CRP-like cAMP-binding protein